MPHKIIVANVNRNQAILFPFRSLPRMLKAELSDDFAYLKAHQTAATGDLKSFGPAADFTIY